MSFLCFGWWQWCFLLQQASLIAQLETVWEMAVLLPSQFPSIF